MPPWSPKRVSSNMQQCWVTARLVALWVLNEFLGKHFPLCLPYKLFTLISPIPSSRLFIHILPVRSVWKLISATGCKDLYSCFLSPHTEVLLNPTQPLHFQKIKPPTCGQSTVIPDLPDICGAIMFVVKIPIWICCCPLWLVGWMTENVSWFFTVTV